MDPKAADFTHTALTFDIVGRNTTFLVEPALTTCCYMEG
jgi:hypothetical protein